MRLVVVRLLKRCGEKWQRYRRLSAHASTHVREPDSVHVLEHVSGLVRGHVGVHVRAPARVLMRGHLGGLVRGHVSGLVRGPVGRPV